MLGFKRVRSFDDRFNTSLIGIQGELDNKQITRLKKIQVAWNFFEGYHWEEIPETDTAEITINYCRAFVNKFVAFELGKAFTFSLTKSLEEEIVTEDGRTLFKFLEDVWVDNKQYKFCESMGQMKSVTGESWVQVRYIPEDELDDPYGEYPNGRIRVLLMPTSVVFAEVDPHDKEKLLRVTVMYSYEKITRSAILGRAIKNQVLYKQIWDKEKCVIIDGDAEPVEYPNKYGVIPFIQIKNLTVAGKEEPIGDLEDIIPLNTELNAKVSDVSEIIDYHSAPITLVYGVKIGNLEKGANKVWGGLPKDAKVENLGLNSDLMSSSNFINSLKVSMCEVGGIPETVLGGATAISNTSGVALQYINLPLIEKTRVKRLNTEDGLEQVNKLILLVALSEGLIKKPKGVSNREFFFNEVTIPDTLPKDTLIELQQLQQEMQLGIESRRGAMKRMGKENIEFTIAEVDEDRRNNPEIYGVRPEATSLNSGIMNGQTTIEQVRREMTGQNGGAQL